MTLEEYGLSYYQHCPDTRDIKTHERLTNEFIQYVISTLGDFKLSGLTASDVAQWQTKMKYYPNPISANSELDDVKPIRGYSRMKNLRCALTLVLNDAVENRKIDFSPVDHVPLVENERKKKISLSIEEAENLNEEDLEDIFTDETVTYTEEQIVQIVKICDQIIDEKNSTHHKFVWKSFKHLMIFKFYSGVRSGEAIGLMWKFVHFDTKKIDIRFTMRDGTLKFPKEEKIRTIDMFPQAKKALRELEKLSGRTSWVFLIQNRRSPYSSTYSPARLWNQLIARAKDLKSARFYNTRHSFTTNMLSRGMSPEWLIKQLGHGSIVITRNSYEGNIEPEYDKIPKIVF